MANNIAEEKVSKLKSLALNCKFLADGDRTIRVRILTELDKALNDSSDVLSPDHFSEVFVSCYEHLLIVFTDSVEKCRELSGKIVNLFCKKMVSMDEKDLSLIIETLYICLASPDEREKSEEVRLIQVQILSDLIMTTTDTKLVKHINNIVEILVKCVVDSCPEVKRLSCDCVTDLAFNLRNHFHMVSSSLINPLLLSLTHQHFKTRIASTLAIGSVIQYGNNASVNDVVSHLAQRLFDPSPPVRLTIIHVIGKWLVKLPDRYSYFPQLIPLLLSAVWDEIPNVRQKAVELWQKVGEEFLRENEKDYKDLIDFPKEVPSDYPEHILSDLIPQPTLGCQVLVQKYFCSILSALINDITDWRPETRMKSIQLLYVILLHCEDKATMKLPQFIHGILCSSRDENHGVAETAIKTAELLGYFISSELWSESVLSLISVTRTHHYLGILAALIRGHRTKPMGQSFEDICNTLATDDVCRNRMADPQANLLLCVEALFFLPNESKSQYSLFTILTSVAGLTCNNAVLQKTEELLLLLFNVESIETALQLHSEDVLMFLRELVKDSELWSSYSPEVEIFIYVVTKGCASDGVAVFVIPVIVNNLQKEKDPKLRSKLLILIKNMVGNIPVVENKELASCVYTLVREGILPNLVWSAGHTATALRAIAVANLWDIIKSKRLNDNMISSIGNELLPLLNSLTDDDYAQNRLLACKILEHVLSPIVSSVNDSKIHNTCQEFLRCLDDESDDVRIASTKMFAAYFKAFPQTYEWAPWKAYLEHFYKNVIIHMDDKKEFVKTAVFELLKGVSHVLPEVLLHEIECVQHLMIASDLCEDLVSHVKAILKAEAKES